VRLIDLTRHSDPQVPMQLETKKSPRQTSRGQPAAAKAPEPDLFLTDNKVRNATIESSTYTHAHEMKPRSLVFNPHRPQNFVSRTCKQKHELHNNDDRRPLLHLMEVSNFGDSMSSILARKKLTMMRKRK